MINRTTVSFKGSIEFLKDLKGDEEELRDLVVKLRGLGIKIELNALYLVYESDSGSSIFGPMVKITDF